MQCTVFLTGDDPSIRRTLHLTGIRILRADDMEVWQEAVESCIRVHCDTGPDPADLMDAIMWYIHSRTDRSETFQWQKQLMLKDRKDSGADHTADAGNASQGMAAGTGDSGAKDIRKSRIRIRVEFVDEQGKCSSDTIEVGNLMNASDCDTSSRESVLAFVSDMEKNVSTALDQSAERLREMMREATKKDR